MTMIPTAPRRALPRLLAIAALSAASGACGGTQTSLPLGAQSYAVIPPVDAVAPPSRYLLGANDTISLKVFQEPDLSSESLLIDPAGNIDLPMLGSIRAEGMSASELARQLKQSLSRYLRDPQVSIALVQSGQTIAVEGAVKQPGVFPIRGRATLLEALALAQSPTSVAANDEIFVFRTIEGKRAGARFDIRRIRAGIDPDPVLLPGDQVVVGFAGLKEFWQDYLGAPIFNLFRIR